MFLILDGGSCAVGIESTIIRIIDSKPVLLRHGGLSLEEIEEAVGDKIHYASDAGDTCPDSPGRFPFHYSPKTPVTIVRDINALKYQKGVGLIAFRTPGKEIPFEKVEVLSADGDLREAAANLFTSLHNLDSADLNLIYAEEIPENGLGMAIMERLRKASCRSFFVDQ